MKFINLIFSNKINSNVLNLWLLVFRIIVGAFLLTHGFPKFQHLISGEEIHFADPIGLGAKTSFILIVFAEFFCSILIILGAFTRLSTIPVMFGMFVASFITHGGDTFSGKESSLIYMVMFASIFITGAGKYSIDYLVTKNLVRNKK
ncbi:MAG: DoxX family protein [Bacteroidales bacterium]|jgi:putative oxidoreductase|nr:DoxX family protein [Bacteroidales bacterium]